MSKSRRSLQHCQGVSGVVSAPRSRHRYWRVDRGERKNPNHAPPHDYRSGHAHGAFATLAFTVVAFSAGQFDWSQRPSRRPASARYL